MRSSILFLATAQLVAAHFKLLAPEWRSDSLTDSATTGFNQGKLPCAGVPSHAGAVTEWPLDGGSLKLNLTHPWSYMFINLGLGSNVTNFNISLTPEFWNITGKGTLCVPRLPVPADLNIVNGTEASLQVITVSEMGTDLVNCADIRFSSSAQRPPTDECQTTEGITYYAIGETSNPKTSTGEVPEASTSGGNSTGSSSSDGKTSAALTGKSVDTIVLTAVAGLALTFVSGLAL